MLVSETGPPAGVASVESVCQPSVSLKGLYFSAV